MNTLSKEVQVLLFVGAYLTITLSVLLIRGWKDWKSSWCDDRFWKFFWARLKFWVFGIVSVAFWSLAIWQGDNLEHFRLSLEHHLGIFSILLYLAGGYIALTFFIGMMFPAMACMCESYELD